MQVDFIPVTKEQILGLLPLLLLLLWPVLLRKMCASQMTGAVKMAFDVQKSRATLDGVLENRTVAPPVS